MTSKPFAWDGRHLPTIDHVRAYLSSLPAPRWARGATIHHTYNPTPESWRGANNMTALQKYYRDTVVNEDGTRGWPAGPHFFNAPDGYWVGTPADTKGVHAGSYNSIFWGIETVGAFDKTPFDEPALKRLEDLVVALFTWRGIPAISRDTVRGHRECGSSKSCPGWANDMDAIRARFATALHAAHPLAETLTRWKVQSPDGWAAVRIAPDRKAPRALDGTARLVNGNVIVVDAFVGDNDEWAHLDESNPMRDLGFVHKSLLVAA